MAACGPNQRILNSAQESPANAAEAPASNATPTVRSFEYDLNAMRTADFNFIYVIRRKDGGVINADDKSFIIKTAPPEMNRRTLADDGKAVIIGSNFRLPAENLTAFRERFAIDDQSKSEFRSADASNQKPAR